MRELRRVLPAGAVALALLTGGCSAGSALDDDQGDPGPAVPAARAAGTAAPRPDLAARQAAVEADPEDPVAHRRLAIALHGQMRKEEALVHFQKAAAIQETPRSLLDLALAYGSLSHTDEAVATYTRLLEISPDNPVALHNLANIELKRGRTDGAVHYYQRALAARPDYLIAWFHLGEALAQGGKNREAFGAYEKALELEPKSTADLEALQNSLYGMAALHIEMNAPQQAAPLLLELVRLNPEHHAANYALGQVLLQLGRPEDAERAFDAHMKILAKKKPTGPAASE